MLLETSDIAFWYVLDQGEALGVVLERVTKEGALEHRQPFRREQRATRTDFEAT